MAFERRKQALVLTTDPSRISLDAVESFLRQTYWAAQRPRDVIARSLKHSIGFAVIDERAGETIAFARIVTDRADFAWLCDVFVVPHRRNEGIAAWMIECIVDHPDLQGLRRMILATSNAHGLYDRFGFTPLERPQLWMERGPNPR